MSQESLVVNEATVANEATTPTYVSDVIWETLNQGIYSYRQNLIGQVLTIIDASIADPEQRKAVKDLVSSAFYRGSYTEATRLTHTMACLGRYLYEIAQDMSPVGSTEDKDLWVAHEARQGGRYAGYTSDHPLVKTLNDAPLG